MYARVLARILILMRLFARPIENMTGRTEPSSLQGSRFVESSQFIYINNENKVSSLCSIDVNQLTLKIKSRF